jgi:hypothetical protein
LHVLFSVALLRSLVSANGAGINWFIVLNLNK